jgi:hypothetical protein
MSLIRHVFGTTRPKDLFNSILTFERLATRPIVHIIYWLGLGLLFIIACAVLGVAYNTLVREALPMSIFLAIVVLAIGWISVVIGVMVWRAFCEFFMAVFSIAEDLHAIRAYQERYLNETAPQDAASAPIITPPPPNDDPFFNQRVSGE